MAENVELTKKEIAEDCEGILKMMNDEEDGLVSELDDSKMTKLRSEIEKLMSEVADSAEGRYMNDAEEARYKALAEVLDLMDEI